MSADVFRQAMLHLVDELFQGTQESEGLMLNPGDPGMIGQLDSVSAKLASTRDVPGLTTIAAHVDHVLYGLTLLNRWAAGEPNPWAEADWSQSWQRGSVNEVQWQDLRVRFQQAVAEWYGHLSRRRDWDEQAASWAIASIAHSAYHLGAIRQILATQGVRPAA